MWRVAKRCVPEASICPSWQNQPQTGGVALENLDKTWSQYTQWPPHQLDHNYTSHIPKRVIIWQLQLGIPSILKTGQQMSISSPVLPALLKRRERLEGSDARKEKEEEKGPERARRREKPGCLDLIRHRHCLSSYNKRRMKWIVASAFQSSGSLSVLIVPTAKKNHRAKLRKTLHPVTIPTPSRRHI